MALPPSMHSSPREKISAPAAGFALGYRLPPRWGSMRKKRTSYPLQMSNLRFNAEHRPYPIVKLLNAFVLDFLRVGGLPVDSACAVGNRSRGEIGAAATASTRNRGGLSIGISKCFSNHVLG